MSFVGMRNLHFMNDHEIEPFDELGGITVAGEVGGVFTKPQMKKDVAKFNRFKKEHPFSKLTFAKFLHKLKMKKGGEALPFDDYIEGGMGVGGMDVGGMYRRKGNKPNKNKASFIRNLMKLGYTKKASENEWENEEQNKKVIGSVKAHYRKAKKPVTRKLSAYNVFVKQERLKGKSMAEIGKLWSASKGKAKAKPKLTGEEKRFKQKLIKESNKGRKKVKRTKGEKQLIKKLLAEK